MWLATSLARSAGWVRLAKGSSVVIIRPVLLAVNDPEEPAIAITFATPGTSRRGAEPRRTVSSVRETEEPSGRRTMVAKYPASCAGMKPLGTTHQKYAAVPTK